MDIAIHSLPDPTRYERLNTSELRSAFLLEDLFQPNKVVLHYLDLDRTVVGGVEPGVRSVELPNPAFLKAEYFAERRELGVMNVGAAGKVQVEDRSFDMNHRDALYIGRGCKSVRFSSDTAAKPARFYLISYPAHASHPVQHARVADAEPLHLGSVEEANKRTIYKYIFQGGIKSCQLVMGFTEMHPGCVWNTMPAHHHMRRSEIYLYFNLPESAAVFHLMGPPQETRHLVVRNCQAAISPGWSIHSGSGTSSYSFIWAMGGENQDYTDMTPVAMESIR